MSSQHPLLDELREREFIYQTTNLEGLVAALDEATFPTAYIGFDCTAKSLHVWNGIHLFSRLQHTYNNAKKQKSQS